MRLAPDFDAEELELKSQLSGRELSCPPLSVLRAFDMDCLPEELAGPARAHLAQCELCQMLLADMEQLPEAAFSPAQQTRIAATLPPQAARSSVLMWQKALIGLAAVLLLAVGTFWWSHHRQAPEVADVKPLPLPTPAQVHEIPFTPLAPPTGPGELLTRGGGDKREPSNDELLPAFRAYNRADYKGATQEFQSLAARYPQSQLVLLYLGVSELGSHQDKEADAALQQARVAPNTYDADAAEWYGALAASRLQSPDAQQLLEEQCAKKTSAYSKRSCDALVTGNSAK